MAKSEKGKGKKARSEKKVSVKGVLRLSPAEMLERKTEIALKNGTLREMCERSYGVKYVQKNFCPDCQYREACKMMKGVDNGDTKKTKD